MTKASVFEVELTDLHDTRTDNISAFAQLHPAVAAVFFALVIGCTMTCNVPLFTGASLLAASAYRIRMKGPGEIRKIILAVIAVSLFVTLFNGFFTHNGATVLFYIGVNRITLEAFAFGAAMSLMLAAVLLWFSCFSIVMTSDRLIYLFGKVVPVFGLVISMIFRFIPLLQRRFREIDAAQKAMGRGEITGPVNRARQFLKEISILTAWSLEASIDSADSMTARGYGLHGRTSFHLFRIAARDLACAAVMAPLGFVTIFGIAKGAGRMYIYPRVRPVAELGAAEISAAVVAFAILLLLPLVIDGIEELRWRRYVSGI